VNPPMNISGGDGAREEDRRKSVLPGAAVATGTGAGGASPAPTATGKQSAGVKAALAALRIYKVYFSILFVGSCRFEPTCSRYAYEAIERFGVMRGSWMGFRRLLRCQPLSRKFGYDAVPEKPDAAGAETGGARQEAGRAAVTGREAHS
jgi:putative membrane protein insertion efficiency factor